MIRGSKICGISDLDTLSFIINHPYPPQFIGFICNYKKSSRYVDIKKLNKLLAIDKKKYNKKIITALTIRNENDVQKYHLYSDVTDIYLFDSKGYEKSMAFDHALIKKIKINKPLMIAGNIQVNDNLENYKKIADIIDISGGLETSGVKDKSKIDIFLNKVEQVKNET